MADTGGKGKDHATGGGAAGGRCTASRPAAGRARRALGLVGLALLAAACASPLPAPVEAPAAAMVEAAPPDAEALREPAPGTAPAAGAMPPPAPEPISAAFLFAPPAVADPTLSPDGGWVAWRVPASAELRVRAIGSAADDVVVPVAGGGEVAAFAWAPTGRRLVAVRRHPGGSRVEVVALAVGGAAPRVDRLLEVASGEVSLVAVVSGPPPGRAVVALRRVPADESVLLAIGLDGGGAVEIARGGSSVERWLVDGTGAPRAAVRRGLDGSWHLLRVTGGRPGEALLSCTAEETCGVLGVEPDGGRITLATDRDGGPGVRLATLDLADGRLEILAMPGGPPDDVGGALFAAGGVLLATWSAGDPSRLDARDAGFAADWQRLAGALPARLEVVSSSADGARLLGVDHAAATVLLIDRASGTVTPLLALRAGLDPARRPVQRALAYPARDGLSIPAVLTIPLGGASGPIAEGTTAARPAVVLPPDDPWHPRRGGDQPLVALLADRGYVVLQPSPRGSAGFGRAFRLAGERQWGGAMLDDLADGVRWLVAEGLADPERVAIVGFGWGGYAAAAGLAFTPDLYAAGVSVGGPLDLEAWVRTEPDPLRLAVLRRRLGDPELFEQRQRLRRHSPLAHAGAIRAPLLRIDLEGGPWGDAGGSAALAIVLDELGRPFEALTVAGGDGRLEGAAGAAVAAEIERFLLRHLGGGATGGLPRVAVTPSSPPATPPAIVEVAVGAEP